MFSPSRSGAAGPSKPDELDISPILAAELATEYSALRAPGNCPRGMYLVPSTETFLRWHGVFFVHRGPYAGSVLRFTMVFPKTYPAHPPTNRFDSDVFHPMVDPKSKTWYPGGRLSHWQPRVHHVSHLLHHLKRSFKTAWLEIITEDEAVNKQVWSLYHHSHQTFLSMTSQRSLHSSSRSVLFPSEMTVAHGSPASKAPLSPTTPHHGHGHRRDLSGTSDAGDPGPIVFRQIGDEAGEGIWKELERSLG
ncbi:hypothetical protein EHS25_003239 [Saitozyma podzolica]|uniref:UBC core domain-containing protein n=1 Tax=Saitozyma podzolica TaxID=1890683 RepID=A0A427Y893_9TREE|nr:hypothetical protein EHS25_003239 [Saitozyma podzolica]